MNFLLILFLSVSSLFGFEVEFASGIVENGKVALLEFKKEKNILYEEALFDDKKYKILAHPKKSEKFYLLIPIDYEEKIAKKNIEIFYKDSGKEKSKVVVLDIKEAKYEKEALQVDSSKVTLSKKDKARSEKEYAEAMKIYNTSTPKSMLTSNFVVPLESKITSDFGKARVYNNTLKGYHGGTDFRASIGTPIIAANDGEVALAKDRFYSGMSILINHGDGIYTCYFHMSRFDVKEGQRVKKGELLGLSGDSGRVSGPHLHFGVRVGGKQVDPLHFMTLINKNLLL
ncbi:Peptidase M23B [Sulfurimonas denitrificans DSM 1251]|jgi:murein DD-endopeptidase MepM/ murein hydrolase activator NlpD|uniref:Peptidase M23B n=1 Tax=Sulfurimonas denitrificans (strain ATCC 33889 / DSM 1251) TaxID=326298 RepID=Q30TF8_SULDN|nr:M23 family metallopeptidase [Sulfurimonas denitrificans]ABB43723.1 Peptidase M23B [Sulfurimonas denitrificans DSM 1251]MDD3442746.1 M23 family metallopeptidase [Sulfurimonas denitrificans]